MRKIIMGLVLALGLTGVAAAGASAAPVLGGIHSRTDIVQADYYYHHHHWAHRHYDHGHWHYY